MRDPEPIIIPRSKITPREKTENHYYNIQSARYVIPVLDKLLETGKDIYISSDQAGLSENSLVMKFNCGWRFLIENPSEVWYGAPHNFIEENRRKYSFLKQCCIVSKIKRGIGKSPGILIKQNRDVKQEPPNLSEIPSKTWRSLLAEWLKTENLQRKPLEIIVDLKDQEVSELETVKERIKEKYNLLISHRLLKIERK